MSAEITRSMDEAKSHICPLCETDCEPLHSSWRYNGKNWEHRCPGKHPQNGHYPSVVKGSYASDDPVLDRLLMRMEDGFGSSWVMLASTFHTVLSFAENKEERQDLYALVDYMIQHPESMAKVAARVDALAFVNVEPRVHHPKEYAIVGLLTALGKAEDALRLVYVQQVLAKVAQLDEDAGCRWAGRLARKLLGTHEKAAPPNEASSRRYKVDCFTPRSVGTGFPENSYDATSPEECTKIIADCSREIAGISLVQVWIRGE